LTQCGLQRWVIELKLHTMFTVQRLYRPSDVF